MSKISDEIALNSDDLNFDDLDLDLVMQDKIEQQQTPPPEKHIGFFQKIPVTVTLEVASTKITLGDLMKAGEGSIIELDKMNGEPLDLKVNGTLLGHAEVVVVNEKYGLRVIDIVDSPITSLEQGQ